MAQIAKIVGGIALVGAVTFGMGAQADDKDVIDYREHIMKTLEEQTADLGMIVSTAVPADNLAAHAEAIALTAKTVLKSFEPKVVGGEAKPEVWAKWADFSARVNNFVVKSQAMVDGIKKGADMGVVGELLVEGLPCKDCHDLYRDEKK